MTYTNKINKCIFYTGTTNQFIRKYIVRNINYVLLILNTVCIF